MPAGGRGCCRSRIATGFRCPLMEAADILVSAVARRRGGCSRVGMWRGGGRIGLSVSTSFDWRCLNSRAMTRFPHPAHRTGRALLTHPALGHNSHRLITILAADVVGYSRLTGTDVAGRLAALKELYRDLVKPRQHQMARDRAMARVARVRKRSAMTTRTRPGTKTTVASAG